MSHYSIESFFIFGAFWWSCIGLSLLAGFLVNHQISNMDLLFLLTMAVIPFFTIDKEEDNHS